MQCEHSLKQFAWPLCWAFHVGFNNPCQKTVGTTHIHTLWLFFLTWERVILSVVMTLSAQVVY